MPTFQKAKKDHRGEKPVVEVSERNAQILREGNAWVEVGAGADVDATDAAAKKADELGVDLTGVEGTGKDGTVLVSDVEKAAKK